MRDFEAICHGSDNERALCGALGFPEASEYQMACMDMADKVTAYYAANGFHPRVSCGGLLMDDVAKLVRLGIELGRRLERAPILDALYNAHDATTPGSGPAVK